MTRGSSAKGYTIDSTGTNSSVSAEIFFRWNRNLDYQTYMGLGDINVNEPPICGDNRADLNRIRIEGGRVISFHGA